MAISSTPASATEATNASTSAFDGPAETNGHHDSIAV